MLREIPHVDMHQISSLISCHGGLAVMIKAEESSCGKSLYACPKSLNLFEYAYSDFPLQHEIIEEVMRMSADDTGTPSFKMGVFQNGTSNFSLKKSNFLGNKLLYATEPSPRI